MGDTIADRLIEISKETMPPGMYSQIQAHESTGSENTARTGQDLGILYSYLCQADISIILTIPSCHTLFDIIHF